MMHMQIPQVMSVVPSRVMSGLMVLGHLKEVEQNATGFDVDADEWKRAGRKLTPAEARLRDAVLATLTEYFNSGDDGLDCPPPEPGNPVANPPKTPVGAPADKTFSGGNEKLTDAAASDSRKHK